MANIITINHKDFTIFADVAIPASFLRDNGVIVRTLDLEVAGDEYANFHTEFAMKRLASAGVSVDTHVAVASCYEDLSGWCDIEKKYEYFSEDWSLMLPKAVVAKFEPNPLEVKSWDEAASLGFSDWA